MKKKMLKQRSEVKKETASEDNSLIQLKIDLLEEIKTYCFEAMNIKVIKPSDYIRVDSAVSELQYKLYKMLVYGEDYKTIFETNVINISSETFLEIYENAPTGSFPEEDTIVQTKIKKYENFLMLLVDHIIKREQKEFLKSDVDKLLMGLSKLNEYINNK